MTRAYLVKAFGAFDAVRAEFLHPVSGALFGTIPISPLLLPFVLQPYSLVLARTIWSVGAISMLLLAWFMISRWMSVRQQSVHATPTWIIPVVGMLDLPLALPTLGISSLHELAVLALAIGLFFAVPLFTMVFSRLLFEPPLPTALRPALLILIAPFAVGYSAYATVSGQPHDLFARALDALNLFVLAVLLGQLRNLPWCPFRVSWWAVSFPLAARAIASIRFAADDQSILMRLIAWSVLILATVVIAGLLVRTAVGMLRGELRLLSAL